MEATIVYKGVEFDVKFDYQPEEKRVMYYHDGSGYCGSPASVDNIYEITHQGTDFMELLEDDLCEIEVIIMDKILER